MIPEETVAAIASRIADPARERVLVVVTGDVDRGAPPVPPQAIAAAVGERADVAWCADRGRGLAFEIARLAGPTGMPARELGVRNGAIRAYPPMATGWADGEALAPLVVHSTCRTAPKRDEQMVAEARRAAAIARRQKSRDGRRGPACFTPRRDVTAGQGRS